MKYLLTLAFTMLALASAAAQGNLRRPVQGRQGYEPYDPQYKRAVYVKASLFNILTGEDDDVQLFPIAVEYDRMISRKFSLVGGVSFGTALRSNYRYDNGDGREDWSYRRGSNLGISAKAAFTQPLVGQRLFLRAEAGYSGIFKIGRHEHQRIDSFVSAVALELYLMVRFYEEFEIMFAPLIFSPSAIKIGRGRYDDYLEMNILPFAVGFRF